MYGARDLLLLFLNPLSFTFHPLMSSQATRWPKHQRSNTDEPRGCYLGFSPYCEPSLKSYKWVLQKCAWAWSSFQWKKEDCNLCHKQNTTAVIPNGGRTRCLREAQCLAATRHQNSEVVSYLYRYMYFTNWWWTKYSRETIRSRSSSDNGDHFCKPQFPAVCTPSNTADRFFFFFNFRGRRRSKKSAVLQLKCMDEVN